MDYPGQAVDDALDVAMFLECHGGIAEQAIGILARSGLSLGLLSNAQSNTLSDLGGISDLFSPELTILSYQHGIAKPSPTSSQPTPSPSPPLTAPSPQ